LLTEYASFFSDDPGDILGFETVVHNSDDAQPIFKKAYQVLLTNRDKIKAQLRLELTRRARFHQ